MNKHILIIDDDEDDCDLFCDAVVIIDSQITCDKALRGDKALNLIQGGYTPDFIFLDLNMPLIDGKKCIVELRKIESLRNVPIIVYTTSKRKDDEDATHQLGANYFITKPSSLTELCNEISFVLSKDWFPALSDVN
jgi:DNA-binding response OmpR family regulator